MLSKCLRYFDCAIRTHQVSFTPTLFPSPVPALPKASRRLHHQFINLSCVMSDHDSPNNHGRWKQRNTSTSNAKYLRTVRSGYSLHPRRDFCAAALHPRWTPKAPGQCPGRACLADRPLDSRPSLALLAFVSWSLRSGLQLLRSFVISSLLTLGTSPWASSQGPHRALTGLSQLPRLSRQPRRCMSLTGSTCVRVHVLQERLSSGQENSYHDL